MDRRIKNMMLYHVKVDSLDLEIWIDPALTGQGLTWKAYDPMAYLHEFTVQRYGDGLWLCNLPKTIAVDPCSERYCNYHGRMLEFVPANRYVKLDSYECPVRGCSVKWWGRIRSLPATQIVRDARKKLYDLTMARQVSLARFRELSDHLWGNQDITRSIENDGLGIGLMNLHECQCFIKLYQGQKVESIISAKAGDVASKTSESINVATKVVQSIRSISIEDLPDE